MNESEHNILAYRQAGKANKKKERLGWGWGCVCMCEREARPEQRAWESVRNLLYYKTKYWLGNSTIGTLTINWKQT